MKVNTLRREMVVNAPLDEVWDFFSSPENLDELTPDNMGFEIISKRPLASMYEGQIIEYKVRPVMNIPLYWKTEILEVNPKTSFVDNQVKGPYTLWHHTHTFTPLSPDQTLMEDVVRYALPLGILGGVAHGLFVKNRLKEIFDYRTDKVNALFNQAVEMVA